jgi:hypothetical protein
VSVNVITIINQHQTTAPTNRGIMYEWILFLPSPVAETRGWLRVASATSGKIKNY